MKRFLLGANLLLFAGSVLALVFSMLWLLITIMFGEWNFGAILYWLTYSRDIEGNIIEWIGLAFLVIGVVFAVLVMLSYLLPANQRDIQRAARGVMIAFLSVVLAFATNYVRFFQFGPFGDWDHLQNLTMNGRVYHLLEFSYDQPGSIYYRFYECDRFDLFCQELYSIAPIGWPNWPTPPSDTRILLVTDPAANTISLQVYGEKVYTRAAP